MEAFEFKTKVKNGYIEIPGQYKKKLGKNVKVIILSDHKPMEKDIIDELLGHSHKIDGFKPFSRKEIYERS